ncbi:MAG: replicative helicase loader/inhibitor [Eubacterium sp.]
MKSSEAFDLLAVLKAAYPNTYKDMKPADARASANLWARMFKDYPYETIDSAVMAFIANDKKGFAPVPGQIMDMVLKLTQEPELTEMDAWTMVSKALKNGIYCAQEEFDKLPGVVQRAVGSANMIHNWAVEERGVVESVIQSNFMRSFRAKKQSEREYAALPDDVKKRFAKLENGSETKQIDGGEI